MFETIFVDLTNEFRNNCSFENVIPLATGLFPTISNLNKFHEHCNQEPGTINFSVMCFF